MTHEAYVEVFLERTEEIRKFKSSPPRSPSWPTKLWEGTYVSHFGWNSTLESMWFGVPMATWPMFGEQQLNAFTLVKEIGVALEIRTDYRRDLESRRSNFRVTAEVKRLMSMDEKMRERVRKISDKGRKDLQDGGSSHRWVGRCIVDVLDYVA